MTTVQHKTTGEKREFLAVVVPSKPYHPGVWKVKDLEGRVYKVSSVWWEFVKA